MLFDYVIPRLFQTSFSKDLIGSDKTNWISRNVSFNMTPKSYLDFLMATQWEELSPNICILQTRLERWQKYFLLAMCSCCWIVGTWGITGHWSLLPQLMQNSATLAIKGGEREKWWGGNGNIGRSVLQIAWFVYFLF